MFYNIISSIYQKIGDLFCPVIFLDFCTVCLQNLGIILEKDPNFKKLIKNYFQNNKDDFWGIEFKKIKVPGAMSIHKNFL